MRLFIGLELPAQMRLAAQEASLLYRRLAPGRYVEAELFHITMAFLGERGEEDLPALQEILLRCAEKQPVLSLSISHPGYFSKPENAILFLSVHGEESLYPLDNRLRAELRQAGQSFDIKPLRPHITLARKVNLRARQASAEQICLPDPRSAGGAIARLTLFHSTRVQENLRYLPIFRADFSHP